MPERGPAQLLLLFFRQRTRLWRRMGLAAAGIALLGLLPGEESVYQTAKTEIAQSLRQAAWKHALAREPEAKAWPWSDAAPVAYSRVPRLGLSAAVLYDRSGAQGGLKPASSDRSSAILDHDPHLNVDLAVGDQITVTRADGTRRAYRVTGWELFAAQRGNETADNADPHYPRSGAPLGALRLSIEAEHADMIEHKL